MTFYRAKLPGCFSAGTAATPVSVVDVVRGPTGAEKRRSKRSTPMRRFNIGQNIRNLEDVYDVIEFFEVMNGPEHSFMVRNMLDYKSGAPDVDVSMLDADIGTGDGSTTVFQLKKQYRIVDEDAIGWSVERNVYLPEDNTVLIAVNGVLQTEITHYTIDYSTGLVTFVSPPGNTLPVTAGFQYYYKVRFDTNELDQSIEAFSVGSTPNIPLVEVLD